MSVNIEQYLICNKRTHVRSNRVLPTNPPQLICKLCGVRYRIETVTREIDPPTEDEIRRHQESSPSE